MSETDQRCPQCHYINSKHSPICATIRDFDAAVKQLLYEREQWANEREFKARRFLALAQDVTLWQGKHALLKYENNALRKKMFPKK